MRDDSWVPDVERQTRQELVVRQARRLRVLLDRVREGDGFYARALTASGIDLDALGLPTDLASLPFTTKAQLVEDQRTTPPWGTVLTEPVAHYTRYSQTSSTTGPPLAWPDTNDSWQWMLECWKAVYRAARVTPDDRILFAFSFGPFLGFWTAFDAASQIGALCLPGGGVSSQARLNLLDRAEATVVCCTPTYALRLAEVATAHDLDLGATAVRAVIVAGEPGGSIPATRRRIERAWGARVIDHHGLTEVGPVSFECWERPGGLHVNECEFIAEVIDPDSAQPVPDGEIGELVLTNLGRLACPVIRYRTGDLVRRRSEPCVCGRTFAWLEGGVLARSDDMVSIRGVNVYPAALESVIRDFGEIVEYRATVTRDRAMQALSLEIEPVQSAVDGAALARQLAARIETTFSLKVPIAVVEPGALPRFELKARRLVIEP